MKIKQPRSGFKLGLPSPFPRILAITPQELLYDLLGIIKAVLIFLMTICTILIPEFHMRLSLDESFCSFFSLRNSHIYIYIYIYSLRKTTKPSKFSYPFFTQVESLFFITVFLQANIISYHPSSTPSHYPLPLPCVYSIFLSKRSEEVLLLFSCFWKLQKFVTGLK